jgi:hypothetical protein
MRIQFKHLVNPPSLFTIALAAASLTGKTAQAQQPPSPTTSAAAKAPALAQNYGKLPLSFEANQGQTDPQVKFLSRGNGYSLFLTNNSAVLALTKSNPCPSNSLKKPVIPSAAKDLRSPGAPTKSGCPIQGDGSIVGSGGRPQNSANTPKTDTIRMELSGANPATKVEGADQLPGTASYFIGNDPSKWHSNVPTYARVKYAGVYPGVDLVYYGNQRQLEYDFVVAPGANPKSVKLHFAGAEKLRLTPAGDLIVAAKNGEIAFHKPVVYQNASNQGGNSTSQRETVDGEFVLLAGNSVGFEVSSYDRTRDLVIDPVLGYSTYLGGSGRSGVGDAGYGIATDSAGNAYVVGATGSLNFPVTAGAFQTTNVGSGGSDTSVFVTKIDASGTSLAYSTYLGGNNQSVGAGIAVDAAGSAYVTGYTDYVNDSLNFPTTPGAFQTVGSGHNVVFVAKLNAAGSGLAYSTYLTGGAEEGDYGEGIAVDATGNAYVTGTTFSSNFPTQGPIQPTNHCPAAIYNYSNAFVTKLNPSGTGLVYSTYLGGSCSSKAIGQLLGDIGMHIAVDSSGDAYVAGIAYSTDFPVTEGAFQTVNNAAALGQSNAFVSKLNAAGSALIYSTYLGGSGISPAFATAYAGDFGYGIAIDPSGHAYVAGTAYSTDFPVTPSALQITNKGAANVAANGFVTKLNSAGSALAYSTYLGGSGVSSGSPSSLGSGDGVASIAIDTSGDSYLTGGASSSNFPLTAGAFQKVNNGAANGDAFVTKLNAGGSSLLYSTYLGGAGANYGSGIAIDAYGNAFLAGYTAAGNFPVTPGAFQTTNEGVANNTTNAFVTKFFFNTTTTALTSSANPSPAGESVTFTATVTAASGITPTGTVTFSIDGGAGTKVTLDGSGQAAYATGTLSTGVHSIVATYSGSTNDSASTGTLSDLVYTPAVLTTPGPGSTLAGTSVTFAWSGASGSGNDGYWLFLGTTGAGSKNLYDSGQQTATSAKVNGLPTNGETIYARLYSDFNGTLVYNDYTYKAASQAVLTTPAPGSTLPGTSATFTWTAATGSGNAGYWLFLGTTGAGSKNLYDSGQQTATSAKVDGLPTNGETIYARVYTDYSGVLVYNDYTYKAAAQAVLTTPAPGSTLPGASATFTWTAATGSGNQGYWLFLGTTGAGSKNLFDSGQQTGTSATVNDLPTNGETIYARVYTDFNGTLVYNDYTYTAK